MSANTGNPLSLVSFPNAVVHVDGDAFFTSVEQALKPELRGKPVITGAERYIVACASYEAKALGIKRPMRLADAKKIYPKLICLPSDYDSYNLYCQRMLEILRRFTPEVECFSIDEAFAGLAGMRRVHHMDYTAIARKMKDMIQKELMITVSLGLGPTKTLAKMASQEGKPDGFTVVSANELHLFLKAMPLERVCGFGPNTVALLRKKGLRTVLDYVLKPEAWAKQLLGKIGAELWHELRGEWVYPVQAQTEKPLSVSKTLTFTPPSSNKDYVKAQLIRNTEIAVAKLRRHGLRTPFLSILLRQQDFKMKGIEAALERPTSSLLEIVRAVDLLFEKLFQPGTLYRATGLVLGKLEADQNTQYSLFDDVPKAEALRKVDAVIGEIHARHGKKSLRLGATLEIKDEKPKKRLTLPLWKIRV
jgi:DNA polymerase-4